MLHKLKATICCLMLSCALYAQTGSGWLDPVSFPLNTNLCDNAAWKLVLYDDFNGTTLNPQWLTYNTFRGMQPGENDNWDGARRQGGVEGDNDSWNAVFLDQNVVVSNGTCKLLVKHEPVDLTCPSCPVTPTRYYTTGELYTPYLRGNTNDDNYNWFNSGRFEVKIKMPYYNKAHTTIWTWPSVDTPGYGVNEIDMVEAYGKGSPLTTKSFYNLHAWGPKQTEPNALNLPRDATVGELYPRQAWWNLWPNRLDISQWHTYTCEWDSTTIKLYLDNQLFRNISKYYYIKRVKKEFWPFGYYAYEVKVSGCITDQTDPYKVTYAYPYFDKPWCNFRITTAVDGAQSESPVTNTSTLLGQAEIDYVKIWQRHPEEDGHTELCAASTYPVAPVISGPNEVCGQVAYTVSPAVAGGNWSSFNNGILNISNPSSSGTDVAKDAGPAFNNGWVAFSYGNGIGDCPLKTVYKRGLYCNHSTDWDVMSPFVLNNNGDAWVHFIADLYHKRDVSGNTTPVITWNVSINRGQDSYNEYTAENYTLYGQYASTPPTTAPGNGLFNIKWTMNVTDASGTWSRSGERNSKTALYQQRDDKNTYYLNAYIDDQDSYDTTVYYSVASNMVSEEEYNDTLYMNEMVEKIRAVALEPYLITDGLESLMNKGASDFDKPGDEGGLPVAKSRLKVFPNPVRSNITIIADARFSDGQAITLHVYDLAGKLIKTSNLNYTKGNIMTYDLRDIADGNYILELQQGSINEHIKITKTKY